MKIVHNWLNLRSEKTSMQVSKYVITHIYMYYCTYCQKRSSLRSVKRPNDLTIILRMPGLIILQEDPLEEGLPNFELILPFIMYVDGS